MARVLHLSLLAGAALLLDGCVASMAASAIGMAVQTTHGKPQSNAQFQPAAAKACSDQASADGVVHVIDVEQRTISKTVVWGTVTGAKGRQSFECSFGTKITGFKLRPIAPG